MGAMVEIGGRRCLAVIRDLSVEGAYVELIAPDASAGGAACTLVADDLAAQPIEARIMSRRTDTEGRTLGVGVKFTTVPGDASRAIKAAVASALQGRA